jgi:hypothetical protein
MNGHVKWAVALTCDVTIVRRDGGRLHGYDSLGCGVSKTRFALRESTISGRNASFDTPQPAASRTPRR